MTAMRAWLMAGVFVVLALVLRGGRAEAANNFVATQAPAPNAPVTMGTTGSLTYQIANQNTGGDAGERIYEVRFRVGGGGRRGGGAASTFSSATSAPAGWTRTSFSTTSVTFRATSWANAIPTGSSLSFVVMFNFRSTSADTNELLRDIRARFTTSTGGPPFNDRGSDTDSNQGGWTLKALAITLQITDTAGVPITSLNAGSSFRLVMTVTNPSTATQTTIRSAPNNPPTATILSGSVAVGWTSTVNNPNPLTLAAGASGTITYTYTTGSSDSGTLHFANLYARNSSGTGTSATATSPTLAVGRFTATINVLPAACLYSGQSFTVQMVLTNDYSFAITGVVPAMAISLGGAPLTLISGPNPAPPAGPVPGNGGTYTFTWVYQVTSTANGETFTFDGSATGTGGGQPRTASASSLAAKAGGYAVAAIQTNASSSNEEISWTFINNGCAATDTVAINFPAGWVWDAGSEDSYSFVRTGGGASVENGWTVTGSGPVTFAAPTVADQQTIGESGNYRLTFSSTPSSTGASITVTITDANGDVSTIPSTVTVNSYNFNSLNDADSLIWQEEVR